MYGKEYTCSNRFNRGLALGHYRSCIIAVLVYCVILHIRLGNEKYEFLYARGQWCEPRACKLSVEELAKFAMLQKGLGPC